MSYNCCIGQNPPSPDGFPPQPVKPYPGALQAASCISRPESVAELSVPFEDDNIDAVGNDGRAFMAKRSFNTFDAVKSKLRKHLSRESALSRRPPRSTVGTSDEEILRRKELRLIRDRRIKEELSSGIAYDDDAKSMMTLTTEDSPYKKPWLENHNEDDGALEFLGTSSAAPVWTRKSYNELCVHRSSPFPILQRRYSLAAIDDFNTLARTTKGSAICRSGSDISIPSAPLLKPQILPSIVDSATRRTSWRLSFSSEQRASQLRSLSQEHEHSLSTVPSGTHGAFSSPLRWFRGEVINLSPLASTNISHVLHVSDDPQSQAISFPKIGDCEGIDGNVEIPLAPISLLEMQISQCLALRSLNSLSSSPQLSSWGSQSHHPSRTHNSEASSLKAQQLFRRCHSASGSCVSEHKFPTAWENSLLDDISSNCAGGESHVKHTSETSKLNAFPLLTSKTENTSLLSGEIEEDRTAPRTIPIIETIPALNNARTTTDGYRSSLTRSVRPSATDDCVLASETLEFREREARIQNVKCMSSKSIPSQTSSVRSRFNEEFDEQDLPRLTASKETFSLFAALRLPKFVKSVVRSYDGASPFFEIQVPGRQDIGDYFSNRSRTSAVMVSPGARNPSGMTPASSVQDTSHFQGDETTKIWSQALKRTQDEYESRLEALSTPVERVLDDRPGSFLDVRSLSRKLKGKSKASLVGLKDMDMVKLPVVDINNDLNLKSYLEANKATAEAAEADEWAVELGARKLQARAKTAAVGQNPFMNRIKRSPESWARFPSHTREERTASAGVPDHVISKDFAIKDVRDGVIEWITSGRKYHHHHHKKEQHHSLPTRMSRQIRTSLYKLRTTKSTATDDALHGRKSSVSIGGSLEYPELEILAGEFVGEGLYREIERETEEEMRKDERTKRKVVFGECVVDEVDSEGNTIVIKLGEASEISIADPRFYEDCIIMPSEDDDRIIRSRSCC